MKKIFLLCFFLFLSNAKSEELNNFTERYPTILSFQSILFQQFKNYFESLRAKSIVYNFDNSKKLLKYTDNDSGELFNIRLSIERIKVNNSLTERIVYSLENSQTFVVEYRRTGSYLVPSSDEDLMTLKMKPQLIEGSFSIKIPTVKQSLIFEKNENHEMSYVMIGTFEFNLKIEKILNQPRPQITYLFFHENMPTPQTFLTVYNEIDQNLGTSNFVHQGQGGLITPKDFFTGIAQASGAFVQAAQESKGILISKGFPKL